jgi:hypothetical protein
MKNIEEVTTPFGTVIVNIFYEDGSQESMTKAHYEAMQAEQSTPIESAE